MIQFCDSIYIYIYREKEAKALNRRLHVFVDQQIQAEKEIQAEWSKLLQLLGSDSTNGSTSSLSSSQSAHVGGSISTSSGLSLSTSLSTATGTASGSTEVIR